MQTLYTTCRFTCAYQNNLVLIIIMLLYYLLFLIGFDQVSKSQGLPSPTQNQLQQCSQNFPINYSRKCCDIPRVFSVNNFESCNLKDEFQENTTYGHADDVDKIDRESVLRYVDKWAAAYPDYVSITRLGKAKCLGKELPGPREMCEANRFLSCFASAAIMACPKWRTEDENCKALKNHLDRCAKYNPE